MPGKQVELNRTNLSLYKCAGLTLYGANILVSVSVNAFITKIKSEWLRVAICLFMPMTGFGENIPFFVKGEIKATYFKSNGDIFKTNSADFDLTVDGKKWLIKNLEGDAFWLRGSDGTNIYHVFKNGKTPVNVGYVENGPMPSGGVFAELPWLAFASSAYVEESQSLFAPWGDPYFEPSVHACDVKIALSTNEPFAPEHITYTVSESRIAQFLNSRFLAIKQRTLQEIEEAKLRIRRAPVGFVTGEYKVDVFTNFQGMLLPFKFRLICYAPQPPRGSMHSNSLKSAVYSGFLSYIGPHDLGVELPPIDDLPVSITDLRIRTKTPRVIDSVSYMLTNEWIVDTSNPLLTVALEKKINAEYTFNPSDKRRKIILFIIVTLGLGVPFIIYLTIRVQNKKANK